MLCITNPYTDPYFNMAVEEYILTEFAEEIFMLWRNEPAVIVGRNQNAHAEINLEFVKDKEIKLVRRLTGGGAVFHDLGNINFTFVKNGADPDFRKFTQPIIEVLQALGVNACFEGRNDLTINGKKFSGNAMTISKDRTLEHGTMLFASNMKDLSNALKPNPLKFEDKAVKSTRSRVTNISEHLQKPLTVLQFRDIIMNFMLENLSSCRPYAFTVKDVDCINELKWEKYSTREWNFGRSPAYRFAKAVKTAAGGTVEFHIDINGGLIAGIRIFGDFFGYKNIADIENLLEGCPHIEKEIAARLSKINLSEYIINATVEELIAGMF
ncbi:MAG: lipoate--protein ligase [Prevotellaceae bacterium]|jgi:lipoate-protein ligase A|nr:lipoate--protein ligase [Prevotellaceae bacterium]